MSGGIDLMTSMMFSYNGRTNMEIIICDGFKLISNSTQYVDDKDNPDSKVHGANMGPIWGRQDSTQHAEYHSCIQLIRSQVICCFNYK